MLFCDASSHTSRPPSRLRHKRADGKINQLPNQLHFKSYGTIQGANYQTIGHAKCRPLQWAAFYFFFSESK